MNLPRFTFLILCAGLAACSNRGDDVPLTRIQHDEPGPDEFAVLPTKPLETPESYSKLPAPTPGAANRVDQNPKADGVAALGGNPAALTGTAPAASDTALVRHANRHGQQPGIRQTLAIEDAEIRRRHGRINILNLGPIDDYTSAYKDEWLAPYAEEQQLRRRGIRTPTNPPPED